MVLSVGNPNRLINGRVFNALRQAAGPPDLQPVDALELSETKMLFRRQAAKIAAAIDHAVLLSTARDQH